jgi:tetratricopeptide (TPR) repeat protein
MPRSLSIPFYSALLALTFCVHTQAANEPPWLEIHSTHFTVITDAGESRGREVALRFEQMRAVFAILLSKDRLHQSIPLTILAFQNDKSYYQLAPLRQGQPIDAPGFFLSGEDQDFIALNLSEQDSWRAVAHDFSMMLLNYNYPPAQEWFDEGLVEYFSSIRLDNRQVEIGGDPELHSPKAFTELLNTQTWLSLPDLFASKRNPATRDNETHQTLFNAQSWILMHYLLHEKKLPETGAYLGMVLTQHVPVEDAVQKAYGMSSAQLEQAVKDYFHSQAAQFTVETKSAPDRAGATTASGPIDRFPAPVGPDDSVITSKNLSSSDARALYAGVQVRIPERREVGLKTLHELATTPTEADKKAEARQQTKRVGEDPDQLPNNSVGNALAHRILAWDYIQHGEFEEAFTEIGDAAALNRNDVWERYYLCAGKYRMAQAKHTEILGLANMMLDLRTVLEWNPEMSDAYDLLALARNAGGTTTAAMQSERAAIMLSPRNELYSYHLAEIYVASKKWEAADALLQRLASSNDPQVAQLARDLASRAGAERKYGIPANSASSAQQKYEAQKTPFDVLEEDAAKRAAAESAQPGTADKRVTKFVKGRLIAVDCSKAPAAILTVSSEAGLLKLRSADYRSLLLIGADDFSCEWRDRQVTANYKPGRGTEGDLVSLEMR